MEQMQEAIASNTSAGGACRPLALSGLGGMGKTQLMLRYSYIHRAEYSYVFWLEVDGKTTAVNSFRKLGNELGLKVDDLKDADGVIKLVRDWLEKRTDWLLLLDNVDNLKRHFQLCAAHGRRCHSHHA